MKILSPEQIREADAYTIKHEPIASILLMERAAEAVVLKLLQDYGLKIYKGNPTKIFCGLGNNGGDGLAIARILMRKGAKVEVYIVRHAEKSSMDFNFNKDRFTKQALKVVYSIKSRKDFPEIKQDDVIIDALFGTGLSKPVTGLAADVIRHINASGAEVISIDMPSGLFADAHTPAEHAVVHATKTLTFQSPKLSFFFPENADRVGEWKVLDIGLDESFIAKLPSQKTIITKELVQSFLKPRKKSSKSRCNLSRWWEVPVPIIHLCMISSCRLPPRDLVILIRARTRRMKTSALICISNTRVIWRV